MLWPVISVAKIDKSGSQNHFCRRTGRSYGDWTQISAAIWYIFSNLLRFYKFLVDLDGKLLGSHHQMYGKQIPISISHTLVQPFFGRDFSWVTYSIRMPYLTTPPEASSLGRAPTRWSTGLQLVLVYDLLPSVRLRTTFSSPSPGCFSAIRSRSD